MRVIQHVVGQGEPRGECVVRRESEWDPKRKLAIAPRRATTTTTLSDDRFLARFACGALLIVSQPGMPKRLGAELHGNAFERVGVGVGQRDGQTQ